MESLIYSRATLCWFRRLLQSHSKWGNKCIKSMMYWLRMVLTFKRSPNLYSEKCDNGDINYDTLDKDDYKKCNLNYSITNNQIYIMLVYNKQYLKKRRACNTIWMITKTWNIHMTKKNEATKTGASNKSIESFTSIKLWWFILFFSNNKIKGICWIKRILVQNKSINFILLNKWMYLKTKKDNVNFFYNFCCYYYKSLDLKVYRMSHQKFL
jgi:hypothetical protein